MLRLGAVVVKVSDVDRAGAFWSAALGYTRQPQNPAFLVPEGAPEAMHKLLQRAHETGREPWATIYIDGHGPHWFATTKFIASHRRAWQQAVTRSSTH
jgi:hypothetical protein